MRTSTMLYALVLGAGLAGCADDPIDEPTPAPTTHERMAAMHGFRVDADAVRGAIDFHWARGDLGGTATVPLDVTHGNLVVTLDNADRLVINEGTLALADVPLERGFLGVGMTRVELRVHGPITCGTTTWTEDRMVAFCDRVHLPVSLAWRVYDQADGPKTPPVEYEVFTALDPGLVLAPYYDNAVYLNLDGDGATRFPWNGMLITTSIDARLDAYAGLID